jgi:hypothetical protein
MTPLVVTWFSIGFLAGSVLVAALAIVATGRLRENLTAAIAGRVEALEANKRLDAELSNARWCLGGRIRAPDDPPIYAMPPGQPLGRSCDEARLAWMDAAKAAADTMRTVGLATAADAVFPTTVKANTTHSRLQG